MDRLTPQQQVSIGPLSAAIVAPAVTGDLNTIAMLDKCGVLGNGEFACMLAAANGHRHVLEYLHSRGYDLRKMGGVLHLAEANQRDLIVRFLQDLECGAGDEHTYVDRAAPAYPTERAEPAYPTVSVLLANYNHARYLDASLSGIFSQEHPATEVIVVDDGSTDGSVELIGRYAERYPNLRLLLNPRNRGQHYSIQRALRAATGDYVVWASSDDMLLPRFLERSLGVLRQHPKAGLCFSRLAVFIDGSTATRIYDEAFGLPFDYGKEPSYVSPQQLTAILRRHYLWMSGNTVVVRRDALLEIRGFEAELRWHADWFAYYAIALRYGACMIPDTLAMMRERPGTYSESGIHDPSAQSKVLISLFEILKQPGHRELRAVFRRCPSILSALGSVTVAYVSLTARHYDLGLRLVRWIFWRELRLMLRNPLGVLRRWLGALRRWRGARAAKY